MLRLGCYLLQFHLTSDWSRNNTHSEIFSGVYGFTGMTVKGRKYYYSHTYHELLDSPIFFPDHSMHKKTSLQIIKSNDYM